MFLRYKDEFYDVFVIFVKMIQTKLNYKIAGIRFNHRTEFENAKIDVFSIENGIHHNFSTPSPKKKGMVDRKNIPLVDISRTMLIDSGLPKNIWVEAMNTMCYLTNRCFNKSILNKTPYELLYSRKPKVSYLRAFCCKCFILNNGKGDLGKFDVRSDEGVFISYTNSSKAYRVFNKRIQCVEESVHVIFHDSGELKKVKD